MDSKLKNKIISSTFFAIVFLMAVWYFGLIISSFNKIADKAPEIKPDIKSEVVESRQKEEVKILTPASFSDRPAYYTYNTSDNRFYGPFNEENIKEGDYYAGISAPQSGETVSYIHFYNKNGELIEINDNTCASGVYYFGEGNIYVKNFDRLYQVRPDLNFSCIQLSDKECKNLSIQQ